MPFTQLAPPPLGGMPLPPPRATDPLRAHIEVAHATTAHITQAEQLLLAMGPAPSPARAAFEASLARLRLAHETFAHFAGGMAQAHAQLATAYGTLPPMPDAFRPLDEDEDEDYAEDGEAQGEAPAEAPTRAFRVPSPCIDAVAHAAIDLPGSDGLVLGLFVGSTTPDGDGHVRVAVSAATEALLHRLAATVPAVQALLDAFASPDGSPAEVSPADAATGVPAGDVVPDLVTVHIASTAARDALRSVPEYRAALSVAPRATLTRLVDAVLAAVDPEAASDGPWRVPLSSVDAAVLVRAVEAVVADAAIAPLVGSLVNGVRLAP